MSTFRYTSKCVCVCVQPLEQQFGVIPDPDAEYHLFDRVVNVRESFSVPLGLRGTVIGIKGGKIRHKLSGILLHLFFVLHSFFFLVHQLNARLKFCMKCCLMRSLLEDSLSGTEVITLKGQCKFRNILYIMHTHSLLFKSLGLVRKCFYSPWPH